MSGGRRKTISDEEFLKTISTLQSEDSNPVITSSELAEEISIGRQGTYQRLEELEDRKLVRSKKVGTGRAWWLTECGRAYIEDEVDADEIEESEADN